MNELLRYSRTFETTTHSHARLWIAWTEVRTERKGVVEASRRRLQLPHLGSSNRMAGPGLDRAGMNEAEAETQRRVQVRRLLRGGSPSQLVLHQASRAGAEWLVLDRRLRWVVCSTHSGCSLFSFPAFPPASGFFGVPTLHGHFWSQFLFILFTRISIC